MQPAELNFGRGRRRRRVAAFPTGSGDFERAIQSIVGHPVKSGRLVRARTREYMPKASLPISIPIRFQNSLQGPARRSERAAAADIFLIKSLEPAPETFDAISTTVSKRYQYSSGTTRSPELLPRPGVAPLADTRTQSHG